MTLRNREMPGKSDAAAVILTDNRGGLGAARSLRRRGVRIIAITWDADNLLLASKVPQRKIVIQGNSEQSKEQHLLDILMGMDEEGPALLTSSDRMIAFIARNRDALSTKYRFNIPGMSLIEALNDKKQETILVSGIGIPIPRTVQVLPASPEDLEKLLRFPILFKPASYAVKNLFPAKNAQVKDRSELHRFYAANARALPVLLAQEVIPGPDEFSWVTSCTFDSNHEMLDCGIKQKIRMNPPHFGGSTFAISADNDDVLELTRKVGRSLDYVGHAGIEFRWDERDREYKYIECNPRMPENVEFDEFCGLPTVWNSYLVAIGKNPGAPRRRQRNGVIFLDLRMDLAARLRDGESIAAILESYLKYAFHKRKGQSFAFDDPMPGFVVAWRVLFSAIRRVSSMLSIRKVDQHH